MAELVKSLVQDPDALFAVAGAVVLTIVAVGRLLERRAMIAFIPHGMNIIDWPSSATSNVDL